MKIICIGRNYADHATELGNSIPTEPLFFLKPDSAILAHRHPFYLPDWSEEIHYEVELLVRISKLGKSIAPEFAHRYYDAISLGIDFTARDIQAEVKAKGHPWEKAKAFDGSALMGSWFDKSQFKDLNQLDFELVKNGATVQEGNTSQMLWSIDALIAEVSRFFTLKIGDVIFTGTPSGVGPVDVNDVLEGYLEGEKAFLVKIK